MKLVEIAAGQPKIYIVGGAVRDKLLGRPPKDVDYVVVGATPEYMEKRGFRKVGADFPVFLDQEGREYALARTERKSGKGYHGFETKFDPSVTIEDDLARRDLTINAMAIDPDTNEVVDPFGGQRDLQQKVLRHVSDAFAEDPLRVLRVARFRARYGFDVAPDTIQLMKKLNPELKSLTKERVWVEIEKMMKEPHPNLFFDTLKDTGALGVLFPDLKFTDRVAKLLQNSDMNFPQSVALLLADTMHQDAQNFVLRWKAPNDVRHIVLPFKLLQKTLEKTPQVDGERAVTLIQAMDGWRQPKRAHAVLAALKVEGTDVADLVTAFNAAHNVTFADIPADQKDTLKGPEIGKAIQELRVAAAKEAVRR